MSDKNTKVIPKTLSGFMELLPNEQILFNQMKETIKNSYERFGFLPLDTPIIELSEILLAKAGGETEKQIYRINKGENDLALRFDLTVPLAKYVSQHYNDLVFPFRGYQIGKAYRGEKPQKGRFREFYQCDIDIIGDGELNIINDAELPSVIYTTFKSLGFEDFTICINNRKILSGFFEYLKLSNISKDIMRIIDKADKIGIEAMSKELANLNLNNKDIEKILEFISIKGTTDEKIEMIINLEVDNNLYNEGVKELKEVVKYIRSFGVPDKYFTVDFKIARGLDYYTGTVYETFLNNYKNIGSVCSGGRYENLAGFYTDKKLPGVGVSIGLTRLFYQLSEIKLIKENNRSISDVLVISMDEEIETSLEIANELRQNGINTEVFLENKKAKNKFKYADRINVPYTLVVGEEERKANKYSLKNMTSGEQLSCSIPEIIKIIKGQQL